MSGPWRSGGERRPEWRVSEKERDEAASRLARFCSEGRLTLEEFSERVEVVLAARTQSELDRVLVDLPQGEVAPYASPLPSSGWLVGIMSSTRRRGRWRPKQKLRAVSVMGHIDLDLRNAEIDSPEILINAWSIMGSIRVTVPEGVAVHLTGVNIMGDKSQRVSDAPLLPGAPLIRVRAVPIMGSVEVRSRRARPSLGEEVRSVIGARVRERVANWPLSGPPPPGLGRRPTHHGTPSIDAREALALAGQILEQLFPRAQGRDPSAPPVSRVQPPHGTVTIQFCDVSGFTEMTERLGDLECQRLLTTFFEIVREQVTAHGGYEVNCHADEAMVAFNGAGQAVRCAIDIQRALHRYNAEHEDRPVRAHIGLHTGEAIQDDGDFLGRTVILASRITDQAAADEILVSSVLHELAATADLSFGDAKTVSLQGVLEPQVLFPVLWS
jgi:class 3 adenylate cyclase